MIGAVSKVQLPVKRTAVAAPAQPAPTPAPEARPQPAPAKPKDEKPHGFWAAFKLFADLITSIP
jgi:hypothetical protein